MKFGLLFGVIFVYFVGGSCFGCCSCPQPFRSPNCGGGGGGGYQQAQPSASYYPAPQQQQVQQQQVISSYQVPQQHVYVQVSEVAN